MPASVIPWDQNSTDQGGTLNLWGGGFFKIKETHTKAQEFDVCMVQR